MWTGVPFYATPDCLPAASRCRAQCSRCDRAIMAEGLGELSVRITDT